LKYSSQGYASLRNIVRLAKLDVPKEILACIEPIKDNDEAIRNFGVQACLDLCRALLDSGKVHGLHFYTLNREFATIEILKKLGLWLEEHPLRALPWKKTSSSHVRSKENVRPIFWSIRPKSYVHRTSNWNEYPNGRWGLSSAPSFGMLADYHLFYMKIDATRDELLDEWGRELTCEEDVWRMFACYIGGEKNNTDKVVRHFPWTDEELSPETSLIQKNLIEYNRRGILTINSQPAVNGKPSSDPIVGWGTPNGYVYQKVKRNIYFEFV
jgi:methylenetetrahydrofolate reductase (NADPH)